VSYCGRERHDGVEEAGGTYCGHEHQDGVEEAGGTYAQHRSRALPGT
jgi:hypothetical protein